MSEERTLQRAYQLIKSGDKDEAVALLLPVVRANPNNADAWWLLANAVKSQEQSRRALEQILKIRPDDPRATRMLSMMGIDPDPRPAAPRRSAPPPAQGTFDENAPFSGGSAPSVYEDDAFPADEPADDSIWDDPFAPSRDDDPYLPPDRRRAAVTDDDGDDLVFDDDPFAPDKPASAPAPRPRSAPARTGRRRRLPDITIPGVEEIADDPFAKDSPVLAEGRSGGSPVALIVLAVLLLVLIGAFVLLSSSRPPITPPVVATPAPGGTPDAPLTLSLTPDLPAADLPAADPEAAGAAVDGAPGLPAEVALRGAIKAGESATASVDTFVDDAWTLEGRAGDRLIIELNSMDDILDPQLYLYTPSGDLLAENDDIDAPNNFNARLEVTLPVNGVYTIIVSAFGGGGSYQLRLIAG